MLRGPVRGPPRKPPTHREVHAECHFSAGPRPRSVLGVAITQTDTDPVHVPQTRRGPYTLCGLAALALGLAFLAWAIYSAQDMGGSDYFKTLFDASHQPKLGKYNDTYHLVEAVVFLIFGGLALAGRRIARGGLIAASITVFYVAGYWLIGLHEKAFRQEFTHSDVGKWNIATYIASAVLGLLIIVVMLAAGRGSAAPASGGYYQQQQPPGAWQQPGSGYGSPPDPGYGSPAGGYGSPGGSYPPAQPPQPPAGGAGYGYPQQPNNPPGGGY